MIKCSPEFYIKSIITGNVYIWAASIVILGLTVGAVNYDVDSWLPFSYIPVLQTYKVATAALIVSIFVLHLSGLGWVTLGYQKVWQFRAYMFGNLMAFLLQMTVGIGVVVIQKRAWSYFQLIALHLCFERFSRQRSRRRSRAIDFLNSTTTEDPLESWFPTGSVKNDSSPVRRFSNANFFERMMTRPLSNKPGPAIPSECLPTDLLTAAGVLMIIAAIVSAYLAFCSYQLWRRQRLEQNRRGSLSMNGDDDHRQEIPPMSFGHPDKPPRQEKEPSHHDSTTSPMYRNNDL